MTLNASSETLNAEAQESGALVGLVTAADEAADVEDVQARIAARQQLAEGLQLARDIAALGVTPQEQLARTGVGVIRIIGGEYIAEIGDASGLQDELNQAYEDVEALRTEAARHLVDARIVAEYGRGTWTREQITGDTRAALEDEGIDLTDYDYDFFRDDGSIIEYDDMSPQEQDAYNLWLQSGQVQDVVGDYLIDAKSVMRDVADTANPQDG